MRRLTLLGAACIFCGPIHAETVDEAIASAVARDPDLAAAMHERDAAEARLDQARAASGPTVVISGTIGAGYLDPKEFFGLPAARVVPRAAQVGAEIPVYAGGRLSARRAQARAGLVGGNAALDARHRQLELDVATAYADAYAARRERAAALRAAGDMKETERQAELLFRSGATARTDYLQAQSRRAEAQAAAARADGNLQVAIARFAALTGLSGEAVQDTPALPPGPSTREQAIGGALARNPNLIQADAAVDAARAARRSAGAERTPTIAAFAEGSTVRDQFFPDYKADAVTVGFRGRWTLFDSGQTSSKVAEANAQLRAAEARARSARRDIEVQAVVAWEALQSAHAQRDAAERQRVAAQGALHDARLEFRSGAKPLLAVLDAERDALAAEAAVARSDGEISRAAWRLHILTR